MELATKSDRFCNDLPRRPSVHAITRINRNTIASKKSRIRYPSKQATIISSAYTPHMIRIKKI